MVAEKQTTTEVVTSTFEITLFNGVILGKSRVNFKKLVDSLGPNLKKAIVGPVLKEIGLSVAVDGDNTSIIVENSQLLREYYDWQLEKPINKILTHGTAEEL